MHDDHPGAQEGKSDRLLRRANYFDGKLQMLEDRFDINVAELFNLMKKGAKTEFSFAMNTRQSFGLKDIERATKKGKKAVDRSSKNTLRTGLETPPNFDGTTRLADSTVVMHESRAARMNGSPRPEASSRQPDASPPREPTPREASDSPRTTGQYLTEKIDINPIVEPKAVIYDESVQNLNLN